jgi:hypothetical protein
MLVRGNVASSSTRSPPSVTFRYPVDVDEPVVWNGRRDCGAEQLPCASPAQRVDAMNHDGLGIGEVLGEDARRETGAWWSMYRAARSIPSTVRSLGRL